MLWLPDLPAHSSNPEVVGLRRYVDLYQALFDHCDEQEDGLDYESFQTKSLVGMVYTAGCGYDLKLELRQRHDRIQVGYTLVETYHGYDMPAIRMVRRIDGPWTGFQLNMEKASPEFCRIVWLLGLDCTSKNRHEFSDFASNAVFGMCCEMMIYGFLKDR
jgi:hypothetical protein